MKKNLLCAVVLLSLVLLSLVACKESYENRKVVLKETPDGHAFYFMPHGVQDITIIIAWPMGWAYDASRNPAVPYIAPKAILSGGTKELAQQDVRELFKDKNASFRFYANVNHAIGEWNFPKEHIEDVISIIKEELTSPKFDQAWIDRIKQGVLTYINQSQAQTASKMWAAARYAILGERPLNDHLSLLDLGAIDNVSIDDLRRWHSETIVKDPGVTIVVVGAINPKDAGKAVDNLLSGLPKGKPLDVADTQPNFKPRTILLHLPDAEKTTLGFIGKLPPTSEGGDLIDLLALNFFSRPNNGPLFDAVRTELRASYGFQAGFGNYDRATRFMSIAGEVETAKLAQAVDAIRTAYEAYRSTPDLTTSDLINLGKFRRSMADRTAKNVHYIDIVAATILQLVLDGRDPNDAPRLGEQLADITAKDVKERLISVFPQSNNLIVVAASPDINALPGACVITKIEQAQQCP